MQIPFEIRKAAIQKALGIGAIAGSALAASGIDPEEAEGATKSDMMNAVQSIIQSSKQSLPKYFSHNTPEPNWIPQFERRSSYLMDQLNQIPEETLDSIKSIKTVQNLGMGVRGQYSPVNSEVQIARNVLTDTGRESGRITLPEALPNMDPSSVMAHETGHHWQLTHDVWPINMGGGMRAEDPFIMAHFLPNSVIPEVLGSKAIPSSTKNKVVDIFHSMYKDPDEVSIALQELSFATKTQLHTPGEVLAAVYDAEVMDKWKNAPTAHKYFSKLGKYMLAVPSLAALSVGIDSALQATDQGSTAEAMPKKLLDAAKATSQKVISGAIGKGGESGVIREAWKFTFPAGPYEGKTIDNIVKSKNSKTFYLAFEDGSVGRLDKEEAKLLAQNIGIGRYLDKWEGRSAAEQKQYATGRAVEKAARNKTLLEEGGEVPAAAEATPIETLGKVHKMGLDIKPYKQVEYRGQVFDLPTQYANLLLAEGVVTIPGEPLLSKGAARAARAKGIVT